MLRRFIEGGVASGLFLIIGTLSTRLFWQLGGSDRAASALLAAVAVLFESSKVLLWCFGVLKKAKGAIALALVLSLSSLFASSSSAIAMMQGSVASTYKGTDAAKAEQVRIAEIQTEIAALVSARDSLPADWIGARERYEKLLKDPRARLEAALEAQATTQTVQNSSEQAVSTFDLVGEFFQAGSGRAIGARIRFFYVLVVTGLLETVAMTLAFYTIKESQVRKPSSEPLEYIVDAGLMHISQHGRTLCGRILSPSALPGSGRACPMCAMKAASLSAQTLRPTKK